MLKQWHVTQKPILWKETFEGGHVFGAAKASVDSKSENAAKQVKGGLLLNAVVKYWEHFEIGSKCICIQNILEPTVSVTVPTILNHASKGGPVATVFVFGALQNSRHWLNSSVSCPPPGAPLVPPPALQKRPHSPHQPTRSTHCPTAPEATLDTVLQCVCYITVVYYPSPLSSVFVFVFLYMEHFTPCYSAVLSESPASSGWSPQLWKVRRSLGQISNLDPL